MPSLRYLYVPLTVLALALPGVASARNRGDQNYSILAFALASPTCPVVRPGLDCSPGLLPGTELVLERRTRKGFHVVATAETNRSGYARFLVHRRGVYRINVPSQFVGGLQFESYPHLDGPVTFRVPAKIYGPFGNTTAVVLHFGTGIR